MNNEPVAWITQERLGYPILRFNKPFRYESYAIQNPPIPLYTHPAKLTDEEIAVIWANYAVPMTGMDFKKVVEAILQKANNG